jgi:hypothetical protein
VGAVVPGGPKHNGATLARSRFIPARPSGLTRSDQTIGAGSLVGLFWNPQVQKPHIGAPKFIGRCRISTQFRCGVRNSPIPLHSVLEADGVPFHVIRSWHSTCYLSMPGFQDPTTEIPTPPSDHIPHWRRCALPIRNDAPLRIKHGRRSWPHRTDYRGFVEICRARADELALSRSEIDRISGLPAGFSGKLLGKGATDPTRPSNKKKKMWPASLELMLGTLGLQIVVIEDPNATARTLALRTPVQSQQQRVGNLCRLSAKLLPKPSQTASPPLLTIVGTKRPARRGKYG